MNTELGKWLREITPFVEHCKLMVNIPIQSVSFAADNVASMWLFALNYSTEDQPADEFEPVFVRLMTERTSNVLTENGNGWLPIKMLAALSFGEDKVLHHSAKDTQIAFETDAASGNKIGYNLGDYSYTDWKTISHQLKQQ